MSDEELYNDFHRLMKELETFESSINSATQKASDLELTLSASITSKPAVESVVTNPVDAPQGVEKSEADPPQGQKPTSPKRIQSRKVQRLLDRTKRILCTVPCGAWLIEGSEADSSAEILPANGATLYRYSNAFYSS
jgi:hypothetical protein